MNKTMFLGFAAIVWALSLSGVRAEQAMIDVKKTASCGCCIGWIKHLEGAGYKVRPENLPMSLLTQFKLKHGITSKLASCHTGRVAGYTIEGHVPVREIKRLLAEKPDAIGLSVPEMPTGSPGMEYGTQRDAYDVLLIKKDGTAEVFAHYTAKK